jgi:hypothetical protein
MDPSADGPVAQQAAGSARRLGILFDVYKFVSKNSSRFWKATPIEGGTPIWMGIMFFK